MKSRFLAKGLLVILLRASGVVNVRLNPSRFLVGPAAVAAVDSVLADGPVVPLVRAARSRRG